MSRRAFQNRTNRIGIAIETHSANGNQFAFAENSPSQHNAAAIARFDTRTAGQKLASGNFFMPISSTLASAMIGSDLQTTRHMTLDRLSKSSSRPMVASSLNRIAIGRPKTCPIQ